MLTQLDLAKAREGAVREQRVIHVQTSRIVREGQRGFMRWFLPNKRCVVCALTIRTHPYKYDLLFSYEDDAAHTVTSETPMRLDLGAEDENLRVAGVIENELDDVIAALEASVAKFGDHPIREPEHKNGKIVLTYGRR